MGSESPPHNHRPPSAEEVATLYWLIGQAVWLIQNFEDAMSHSIAVKLDLKDVPLGSLTMEDATEVLSKYRKLTLGQAVVRARANSVYGSDLLGKIANLLEERNWLVHRLIRERGSAMNNDTKRDALFARIKDIATTASDLQKALANDLEATLAARGANLEMILKDVERRLKTTW